MTGGRTAIVGAGRMGQGIGLGLAAAGWDVLLLARTDRGRFPAARACGRRPHRPMQFAIDSLVLVATPDDAIAQAAPALAASGGVGRDHVGPASLRPARPRLRWRPSSARAPPWARSIRSRASRSPHRGSRAAPRRLRRHRGRSTRARGRAARRGRARHDSGTHRVRGEAGLPRRRRLRCQLHDRAQRRRGAVRRGRGGVPPEIAARMYLPLGRGRRRRIWSELGAGPGAHRTDTARGCGHDPRPLWRRFRRAASAVSGCSARAGAPARARGRPAGQLGPGGAGCAGGGQLSGGEA